MHVLFVHDGGLESWDGNGFYFTDFLKCILYISFFHLQPVCILVLLLFSVIIFLFFILHFLCNSHFPFEFFDSFIFYPFFHDEKIFCTLYVIDIKIALHLRKKLDTLCRSLTNTTAQTDTHKPRKIHHFYSSLRSNHLHSVSTGAFLSMPDFFIPSIPTLLVGGNYTPTANRPPAEARIIMLYRHSLSLLPLALQTPDDKFYQRDTIKRHH